MDETTYQRWWPLHLRTARGEILSDEERSFYENELSRLYQDEQIQLQVAPSRNLQLRERIEALEAERTRLEAKRKQLDEEIAALEAALNQKTRQLLGVGD